MNVRCPAVNLRGSGRIVIIIPLLFPMEANVALITLSRLTCPNCGFAEELEMPLDACQFFHQCGSCGTVSRPQVGDCCVFCSYGDAKCPSMQPPLGNKQ